MLKNGYDLDRVDRIVYDWVPQAERGSIAKEDKKTETQLQEEEARVILKVPYVRGVSEEPKKSLEKAPQRGRW